MKNSIIYFCIIIVLTACAPATSITSSWKEPNKKVVISDLKKVLVVALFKSETSRHKAEDDMVGYLQGKGVVSYNYLNSEFNTKDEKAIREKIRYDGFDGAITMRLIDVEKESFYSPNNFSVYPSYYNSFSGYYYRSYPFYDTPNYYINTRKFIVETNVFSIKEDRIIWTCITETIDPSGVDKMMDGITKVVYAKMKSDGFIVK